MAHCAVKLALFSDNALSSGNRYGIIGSGQKKRKVVVCYGERRCFLEGL